MLHQFFSVLVAMLFSFSHHAGGLRPVNDASMVSPETLRSATAASVLTFPDRHDLARPTDGGAESYAGAGCLSCRTMTVTYAVR